MIKVKNMVNQKTGEKIIDQFIIETGPTTIFQSGENPIIEIDRANLVIKVFSKWNYDETTQRYRNLFLYNEGLIALSNNKAFEHYMNLGKYDIFSIVKAF